MPSLLQFLDQFGRILQQHLFPALHQELGVLGPQHQKLVRTLGLLEMEGFHRTRGGRGRPGHDRGAIARAFVAKAVFHFPTTRALLDRLRSDVPLRRLCGWETAKLVPDETVFSRAFAVFAESEFPQRVHALLIARRQAGRLVGHISRDATAIEAREKPAPKPTPAAAAPTKARRKAGQPKRPEQLTRIERQCSGTMTQAQMLAELPRLADVGCKTNSNGHKYMWIGYKLHLDVADGQIPISCLLTSASLHDSQAAVPLAQMTAARVTSLYDLMDSAYESHHLRRHSEGLGHVPIIDGQKRGSQEFIMAPHTAMRFRERTAVERVYARLKEEFGAQTVRVRGAAKVMAYVMFGILALTVDQLLRLGPAAN